VPQHAGAIDPEWRDPLCARWRDSRTAYDRYRVVPRISGAAAAARSCRRDRRAIAEPARTKAPARSSTRTGAHHRAPAIDRTPSSAISGWSRAELRARAMTTRDSGKPENRMPGHALENRPPSRRVALAELQRSQPRAPVGGRTRTRRKPPRPPPNERAAPGQESGAPRKSTQQAQHSDTGQYRSPVRSARARQLRAATRWLRP
jgi:hypothetical protein